jgi:hypothetical protein
MQINHLTQHSMINMTLKWHQKNITNKIIIFIEIWYWLIVFFDLFDYECTQSFKII